MPKVVKWRKIVRKTEVKVTIDQIEVFKSRNDGVWQFQEDKKGRGRDPEGAQTQIKLFFPDLCVFGRHQLNVPASGVLRKRLSRHCPPDTYKYAAYFKKWDTYAVGHSSPIIVVKP